MPGEQDRMNELMVELAASSTVVSLVGLEELLGIVFEPGSYYLGTVIGSLTALGADARGTFEIEENRAKLDELIALIRERYVDEKSRQEGD